MDGLEKLSIDLSTVTVPFSLKIGEGSVSCQFDADISVTKIGDFMTAIQAALVNAGVDVA